MRDDENPGGKGFPNGENEPLFIAHKSEDGTREEKVLEHLRETARLAEHFAGAFEAGDLGYLTGLVHDIGKYSREFQRRIRYDGPKVDHSTAGAKELYRLGAAEAALCAAGYHGGLPEEGMPGDLPDQTSLHGRLKRKIPDYSEFAREVALSPPTKRMFETEFQRMFFVRMLFSALTDADFLATEDFMSEGKVERGGYDGIPVLLEAFEGYVEAKGWNRPQNDLNRMRRDILERCREAAKGERGLYSLTVPTGGGKTAASLAFALHHGAKHGLSRVIYVVPYTSIIEQTAKTFREMLGEGNVLEHHSNVSFDSGDDGFDDKLRLSAENWDAPVIVTTSVQFFESLYANRPSRCRKLHNIAGSVVIFDEVQMLPLKYLRPCTAAMDALVADYGVTAVLCTATQPSLDRFFSNERKVQEICPNTDELYRFFRRTKLVNIGRQSLSDIAERMRDMNGALTVVATRKQAYELFLKLPKEGRFHLSTLMCPVHRSEVLAEIRRRLKSPDKPLCRVAATSLVEAGVDVDFPAVFRAEAGLDSIIQAAGRCNREGKNPWEESFVYIFMPEDEPPGRIKKYVEIYRETAEFVEDLASPEAIRAYFDALHEFEEEMLGQRGMDEENILRIIEDGFHGGRLPFPEVDSRFRLIDTDTKSVLIPWDDKARKIRQALLQGDFSRKRLREAGPYLVNIYPGHFEELERAGDILIVGENLAVLTVDAVTEDTAVYSKETGLSLQGDSGKAIMV